MKLAEALAERSECQNRIEEVKKRLVRSARIQEGESPAEDTTELLAEAERVFARLLELFSAINRTNSKTAFDDQWSISMQLPNGMLLASVAISWPVSQRQEAHDRIVTLSRRCDLLRLCQLANCRPK